MSHKKLAGCVIYDEDGKLLLIHRQTPNLVQWELPGGKQEKGESLEQTAIRECLEELTINVRIKKNIGNASFSQDNKNWDYTWFEAELLDGQSPKLSANDQHSFDDVRYIDIQELRQRNDVSPNVKNLLMVLE